ncbi:TetR/AcrR family transcriptional regulator [Actinospongicola halichondriae]|uniref:TetR/AcrR family transcriptional regulator n=1 Tax=Actinospongicola halichondriae TaxID=3236844 RepID=UPI003D508788
MSPNSSELDGRILDAARALVDERGHDAVTISAVADRAGVSRPTVYRRWPNRAALLFDLELRSSVPNALPDLGSFAADLRAVMGFLHHQMASFDREMHAERLALMLADREFAGEVHRRRWIPDRGDVLPLWERGVARGELDPEMDGAAFLDDVVSAAMFRVFFWHVSDDSWIDPYVDRVCRGVVRQGGSSATP